MPDSPPKPLYPQKMSLFTNLSDITSLYGIIDPLQTLLHPLSKLAYKQMVKKAILNYWSDQLYTMAVKLPSLTHMNLAKTALGQGPHPIWRACDGA